MNRRKSFTCAFQMPNPKVFRIVLAAFIYLGVLHPAIAQDMAQLAVKARDNLYDNWDFKSAAYYFDQVIGEKYAPAFAYSDYGWYLLLLDRYEEGMTFIEKAAKMAPKDKQLVAWNAWALYWKNDLTNANQWIQKSLKIDANYGEALQVSSKIASQMGNHQEAIRIAEKAASNDPNWRAIVPWALAKAGKRELAIKKADQIANNLNAFDAMLLLEVYGILGNDDKALHFLEKSYELKHPFMPWLQFVAHTEHLQEHPRFKAIVKKMNLPQ